MRTFLMFSVLATTALATTGCCCCGGGGGGNYDPSAYDQGGGGGGSFSGSIDLVGGTWEQGGAYSASGPQRASSSASATYYADGTFTQEGGVSVVTISGNSSGANTRRGTWSLNNGTLHREYVNDATGEARSEDLSIFALDEPNAVVIDGTVWVKF